MQLCDAVFFNPFSFSQANNTPALIPHQLELPSTNMVPATTTPPGGIFVPVPTFFKEKAQHPSLQPAIDIQTQVAHSLHLAKSGVAGLVLLGSTGEAIHMSSMERVELISGVRKGLDEAGFTAYPILSGVLVNSV
ncbi:dihydrodipicolinate synthase, partial [Lasius niger]